MPETAVAPAAPSTPIPSAPPSGGTPPTPAAPSTPSIPDVGGEGGESAVPTNPTNPKFKFTVEDGESPIDLDLTDVQPEEGDITSPTDAFKFEQLDAIKESHADLYKAIKAELSKAKRFGEYGYKTPEDAKAQNTRITKMVETIGQRQDGKVGLDAVEATLGDLANAVVKIQNGDPATIAKILEKNPNADSVAQRVYEEWGKTNSQAAEAFFSKRFMDKMNLKDAAGTSAWDSLVQLYDHVKDNPDAVKLLGRAAYTLNEISKAGDFKPDPNAGVATKEAELKAMESQIWARETELDINPIVRTALNKGLSSLTSELKKELSADERTEYRQFLEDRFTAHAQADETFMQKFNDLTAKRDREGLKQLLKASRGKYTTFALKDLFRAKLLNRDAIRKEGSSKTEAGGGGSASSNKPQVLQYTGKMKNLAPAVDFDYQRISAHDNENGTHLLEDHMFFIKGKKDMYRW